MTGHLHPQASVSASQRIGKSILHGQVVLRSIVGAGAYGVVYEGYCSRRRCSVAVKALKKRKSAGHRPQGPASLSPENSSVIDGTDLCLGTIVSEYYDSPGITHQDRLYREVALHGRVHRHPNILSIYHVFESTDTLFLVMEYFPRGDLFHAITDLKWYVQNDTNVRRIFSQLLSAVSFCHSRGVYHCDLKPENVLVSEDGTRVVVADFGLATSEIVCHNYGCGSSFYMSPERLVNTDERSQKRTFEDAALSHDGFPSPPTDVWAMGVILLNLTCGRNPWKSASVDDPSFRAFLRDPKFLERIMPISTTLGLALRSVFESDPYRRPTVVGLRNIVDSIPSLSLPRSQLAVASCLPADGTASFPEPVVQQYPEQAFAPINSSPIAYSRPALAPLHQVFSPYPSPAMVPATIGSPSLLFTPELASSSSADSTLSSNSTAITSTTAVGDYTPAIACASPNPVLADLDPWAQRSLQSLVSGRGLLPPVNLKSRRQQLSQLAPPHDTINSLFFTEACYDRHDNRPAKRVRNDIAFNEQLNLEQQYPLTPVSS